MLQLRIHKKLQYIEDCQMTPPSKPWACINLLKGFMHVITIQFLLSLCILIPIPLFHPALPIALMSSDWLLDALSAGAARQELMREWIWYIS